MDNLALHFWTKPKKKIIGIEIWDDAFQWIGVDFKRKRVDVGMKGVSGEMDRIGEIIKMAIRKVVDGDCYTYTKWYKRRVIKIEIP